MNYSRDPIGALDFRGMNTVLPPDRMPPSKYPFAQNVRRYIQGGIVGRSTLDSTLFGPFGGPVLALRRLNDLTPAGPAQGYCIISSVGSNLFVNNINVDSSYSGKGVSLVPFRPNQSVQPWMYVADSAKMSKVRSDGTVYKWGIKEPQSAPVVNSVPAADVLSTLGEILVYYFNNPQQAHNAPLTNNYLWHNPADKGPSSLIETAAEANGSNTGNSLLFDFGLNVGGANPVAWSVYQTFIGTVSTNGTAVTWNSGQQFGGLANGNSIVINGQTYTISGTPTNTTMNLTTSAGVQNSVNYSAANLSGTVPLFAPQMETEGFQDFNCSILGTFYVPHAGTYAINITCKDDFLWGIGNSPSGGTISHINNVPPSAYNFGQTITTINGYPLLPRLEETSGEDGFQSVAICSVTFSAPGNYPFEIDWDYWFHKPRGLSVQVDNGDGKGVVNIPPIPPSTITDSQYRYVYRSSATGAVSNPSPESPQSPLSVLANTATAVLSTDPQVDKVDFYRLDEGLTNFTYVGTMNNASIKATLGNPVTVPGIQTIQLALAPQSAVPNLGDSLFFNQGGANAEATVVEAISQLGSGNYSVTVLLGLTHAAGIPITSITTTFADNLLDIDVADNPILAFDNFEPFPSIDLPKKGFVNTFPAGEAGIPQGDVGQVQWVSGDQFNPRWLPGTLIRINGVVFTLFQRPFSATALIVQNIDVVNGVETPVIPGLLANVPYEINQPDLAAQPMPYVWGPTDNAAFMFGCGDPLRPGTLYWTKGNNPDSAPDTNQQDVTSPSEPLQNGCIVGGFGMVFSSERAWIIWPNYFNALATVNGTQGDTWTLQETITNRGLYMPRCLTVDGGRDVYFRAKDGIYKSPGGQGSESITDADLFNIFPHEGVVPAPVTIAGNTIFPPDDTQPFAQKLSVATGYLYYDYVDKTGTPRTLVFDISANGWVWDVYSDPVTVHALEEGPSANDTIVGCTDGTIRRLDSGAQEPVSALVLMPSFNAGDTRNIKHWGDAYLEMQK